MKYLLFNTVLLFSLICYSQTNTEVYLFDLDYQGSNFSLSNIINVSNNEGYDSQPSFINDHLIVYSSTNGEQTDIKSYNINSYESNWVTQTNSSEFSPTKIPDQNAVSAIRQGLDNTQKLYSYSLFDGKEDTIIEDLLIGYHVWANKDVIYTAILENEYLSLSKTDLKRKHHETIAQNIGRSLHRIPTTNLISYVDKSLADWTINSIDIYSNEIMILANTLKNSEDMCWTPNGLILMGQSESLFYLNPKNKNDWQLIESLNKFGLKNITRINVNASLTKLVLVAEKKE